MSHKQGQQKDRKDEQSFNTGMMTQIGRNFESVTHLADFHTDLGFRPLQVSVISQRSSFLTLRFPFLSDLGVFKKGGLTST